ncbi:MAG: hypothetical protein ACYDA3_07725 [Gaiellaceae bacterium]
MTLNRRLKLVTLMVLVVALALVMAKAGGGVFYGLFDGSGGG